MSAIRLGIVRVVTRGSGTIATTIGWDGITDERTEPIRHHGLLGAAPTMDSRRSTGTPATVLVMKAGVAKDSRHGGEVLLCLSPKDEQRKRTPLVDGGVGA